MVLHLQNVVKLLLSQLTLSRVVKPNMKRCSPQNASVLLDRPVVDVGEQGGLLLLAVALPHQQLLHCRQGQAHHDLDFSEIILLEVNKTIKRNSSLLNWWHLSDVSDD